MIKDAGSKYDYYSISPKIRQIFVALGLWINWKRLFYWFFKLIYKKWVTTGLIDKNSCKKQEKDIIRKQPLVLFTKQRSNKRKVKNQYKNLSLEEKDTFKEYQKKIYQQLVQYKKEALTK